MVEHEVLDALVTTWATRVAHQVRPDCCVLAARVASLTLDYYGIPNKVLAGELFVFNDAALALLDAGFDVASEWPVESGAWSIAVGRHSPGKGLAGHLLVRLGDGALVDLSASQFNRPGLITVDGPRVWREIHTDHEHGTLYWREGNAQFSLHVGGVPNYRTTLDWRTGNTIAAQIIRFINNKAASK